jgi:hypothetical protein
VFRARHAASFPRYIKPRGGGMEARASIDSKVE